MRALQVAAVVAFVLVAGWVVAGPSPVMVSPVRPALAWSLVTTAQTATLGDCGRHFATVTDGVTVTLPAAAAANAGCCVTLHNIAADDAALVAFSVNASDAVFGQIANATADVTASGADDQAWSNTKAGANKGDYATLCSDGSTGWFITGGVGVWASAAQ